MPKLKPSPTRFYEFAPFQIHTTGIEELSCHRYSGNGCYYPKQGFLGAYLEFPWDLEIKTPQDWLDEAGIGMVSCKDVGIYSMERKRRLGSRGKFGSQWFWVPSDACHLFVYNPGKCQFEARRTKDTDLWEVKLSVPYGKSIPIAISRVWRWILPPA